MIEHPLNTLCSPCRYLCLAQRTKQNKNHKTMIHFPFTHFFLLFASCHTVQCAVFSKRVHCVSIQEFDGTDKASTGPAMMEVAVRVTVVNVSTYETLLIA